MSNSYAQPILRTADLAEALRTVARLLEVAHRGGLEVDFDALVLSEHALEPLIALLPDAEWWSTGSGKGSSDRGDSPSDHIPLRLQRWCMPPDSVEPVLAAAGDSPATVRWDFDGWPAAPDIGLDEGGSRGAYVTLCSNTRDLDLTDLASGYTVFVHVKQIEAERAPWLAAQVGLRVIGELVMAPY